jgi:hypothetical protein
MKLVVILFLVNAGIFFVGLVVGSFIGMSHILHKLYAKDGICRQCHAKIHHPDCPIGRLGA